MLLEYVHQRHHKGELVDVERLLPNSRFLDSLNSSMDTNGNRTQILLPSYQLQPLPVCLIDLLSKVRRSSGLCLILWIGLTCWVLTIFSMSFYYYIKIPVFSLKCTSANLRIYFQTKISCQKSREIVGRFINGSLIN